jgi:hypothetical protein
MSELVGSVCLGLADLITDGITYFRLASGDIAVLNEEYKAAYVTILCFGAVTTVLSLASRLRNARRMQAHLLEAELGQQGRTFGASQARRQLQQNEWELVQTHRTKTTLSLSLLSVMVQGMRHCARHSAPELQSI